MKKLYPYLFIIMIIAASCNSTVHEVGNGNMVTKNVEVENFEEVFVSGNYTIFLEKGDKPALTITADENLMQYIETEVRGDQLKVESTENIKSDEGLKLNITYDKLTSLEIGGAAEIENEGVLVSEYFNLDMSGAGSVDLDLDVKHLELTISGAGSVNFKGKAIEQEVQMSGAGEYDAKDLLSQTCRISISGVGSADVNVEQKLVGEVSGVGGITYWGNPQDVQTNVSGLGGIDRAD